MASKSTGQIIGTVVGAVVGFFVPGSYVALGAALGGVVGGLIDPPKGPTIVGPRLDDLSFQTSTLGAPLGRAYGTVPVLGNVVWLEGDKYREVITSEEQGGKGGSSATYETAHYYATFAVSLLRVTDATKTVALRRMWIGSNLVYDAGSDNLESIIASNSQSALFTFYSGSDDQQPNTRWQADKGANAVSGFPGRCYIVIYDLDLEPYSRSLAMAQVKVELVVGDYAVQQEALFNLNGSYHSGRNVYGMSFERDSAIYSVMNYETWSGNPTYVEFWKTEYGVKETQIGGYSLASIGYTNNPFLLYISDSDRPVLVTLEGYDDGYGHTHNRVRWHELDGSTSETQIMYYGTIPYLPYYNYSAAIDGDDTFLAYEFGGPVYKMSGSMMTVDSGGNYKIHKIGLSENYLFGVYDSGYTSSSTTVYKFDRTTLALVDTFTQSVTGSNATIYVVNDDLFYTLAVNHVYRWESGVVVSDLGALLNFSVSTDGLRAWFKVISDNPPYGFSFVDYVGLTKTAYLGHAVVSAETESLREIVTAECALAGLSSSDIDLTALTDSAVRGYRVANAGSIRSSLEILQAAYPFDVAPSGYDLRFVSRGGSSLVTIPETDLGAASGDDSIPLLFPMTREMDTQVPYKVALRYLDPAREYDIAEQYASRPDTASVSERTVELPLVMTGDEAAKTADILNQKDWLERVSFGPFSLPPTYREIEPPDVVTIEHRGQSHSIRLTKAEFLQDGRIECAGVYSSGQSYTSTASAQDSLTIGQSLVPLKGSTQEYLLDIPMIRSEQDVLGMSYAMSGLASGWPGGVLLRSDDSGGTWLSVGSTNNRANVFASSTALSSHHGYSIDNAAVLTVTPLYSAHTLSSVTEDQLYAHANIAAYGADGRWEVVSFRTVTENSGTYTLTDFLRGLHGTEWASGLHESGDLLIMLDGSTIGFFGLPANALGSVRLYRAVTQGASIESAENVSDTYDAVNLKPLSPVDMKGSRDPSTLDWTITWKRRTRTPVELFSGVAVPLGETSESYDVEVWNSDYSALKRTFSALSSLSIQYTNAQQVTDFGSVQDTLYLKSYQVSPSVGRGFPYTQSIYRYMPLDPFGDQVVLLQSMNDAGLTDFRGHTVTCMNGVTRSATYSQEGGYSAYFNGTSQYYYLNGSSDFSFGTGDFTIEGFIRPASVSVDMVLFDFRPNATNGAYVQIAINSSGQLCYYVSAANRIAGAHGMSTTAFSHYALVRQSGVSRLYSNGVQVGSNYTDSNNFGINANRPNFGVSAFNGTSAYFSGYADQQRITKAARYTGNFTPPTSFPDP